jgi:hypothetical protein
MEDLVLAAMVIASGVVFIYFNVNFEEDEDD